MKHIWTADREIPLSFSSYCVIPFQHQGETLLLLTVSENVPTLFPKWTYKKTGYKDDWAEDESGGRKFVALKCVIWMQSHRTDCNSYILCAFCTLSCSWVIMLLWYKALKQQWRKAFHRFSLNGSAFGSTSSFYLLVWALEQLSVFRTSNLTVTACSRNICWFKNEGWEHGLGPESLPMWACILGTSLLGHRPCLLCYSFVCGLMDGVFKFQHLARGRSDVSEYHSPGEEENKYQEAGWRQVEALGRENKGMEMLETKR